MMKPISLQCCHTICHACVDRLNQGPARGQVCPYCREKITVASVNVLVAALVSSLAARCINDGSPWTGKVEEHEYHLPQCQFRLTNCRYQHAGCSVLVQRQKMSRHELECPYRPSSCTQCHVEVPMADMDRHQANTCKRLKCFALILKGKVTGIL